ncbi:anti-sigma factor family protein [Urbifossiella limnaea]|uniref:Zinc-finger domain-containing protein n=1 Tax=Urbifossiella limnaea TaxID=2528023 RepID=A0A517XUG5_9BACT|nr:hypothetical protein [Urbifossiella limnaea]QDU21135.1 hypothetical protein ETAA1_31000 [Urbifossiella limnaea]
MTPDDALPLLTAAVDGELTPAEAEAVRALLADSSSAWHTFRNLRADRQRLQQLTPVAPPADLHARIMARLPAHPPTPVEVARPVSPSRKMSLVPVGLAASVLVAMAGASFTFFVNRPNGGPSTHGALLAKANPKRDGEWAKLLPRDAAPPSSSPAPIEPIPEPVAAVEAQVSPELAPEPRAVVRDVLTFPPVPAVGKLDLARVRVPFLATVAEFDREDVQQQFVSELRQDLAFRIDLFARDPARGVELFQAAAKGTGLNLLVDRTTAERVQRKQAAAYLVYTDSLTATDLRDLLVRLATADAKAPSKTFEAVHTTAAVPADGRDLRELLGTDPGLWKRPMTTAEPKSVSSDTVNQLTRNLTDPKGKGGDRLAVLTTYAPREVRTVPGRSAEVRQFFERRGDRRPTAVPVLVVVRQANG